MTWECAELVITDSITTKCYQTKVNNVKSRKYCCVLYLLVCAGLFYFKKSEFVRGETAGTDIKRVQNNASSRSATGCSSSKTGWKPRFLFGWSYVAQVLFSNLDWLICYMILPLNSQWLTNSIESWMILISNQEFY